MFAALLLAGAGRAIELDFVNGLERKWSGSGRGWLCPARVVEFSMSVEKSDYGEARERGDVPESYGSRCYPCRRPPLAFHAKPWDMPESYSLGRRWRSMPPTILCLPEGRRAEIRKRNL